MADKEVAVPKFGEWNDRDATPPDNYTAIFTKVREERQDQGARTPTLPQNSNIPDNQNDEQNQKKCCCFPWPSK
ncbi:RPM1-interacting protein 4, partial [Cucurbita argyrosperma subsp. sororia]